MQKLDNWVSLNKQKNGSTKRVITELLQKFDYWVNLKKKQKLDYWVSVGI